MFLSFIGWSLEHNDCFSVSAKTIDSVICDSIKFVETVCQSLDAVPFKDFGYETSVLLETARTLYLQQSDIGNFAERNRYAFCHHQFRDYFRLCGIYRCFSCCPVYHCIHILTQAC